MQRNAFSSPAGVFDLCTGVVHLSPATGRGGSLSYSETRGNKLIRGGQRALVEKTVFTAKITRDK